MAKKKARRNIYTHSIDLTKLRIINAQRNDFRTKLEQIAYRGYDVEDISDGRKIVIAKPGGKSVYGKLKKEDFFVWVFNPAENSLWQISHKQILEDLIEKAERDVNMCLRAISALELVHNGLEPDEAIKNLGPFEDEFGEPTEVLLKSYKWIWGQEDVNYPDGEGRDMSMKAIQELKQRLQSS